MASELLAERHAGGLPPLMHWRGHWYEWIASEGSYFRLSAGWMLRLVNDRVGPKLQQPVYSALLGLSIQPDITRCLPPLPTGRVNREEFNQ
ncbi:hypothetical protein [Streptomyces erythrochromogenes]|uniref:hypothetical protein n=1 Tax=Streptomyces erythrochromogenes TaxID=285574 RepID=UPI003816F6F3